MNEHVDYQAKPSSAATRFLWWCAGADEKILKYSSYADHVKYVGIGGVVLATGFMAALSMGFAIHIIFDGKWAVTIPVALAWALIVFNLDRFIVSSTGKGDGDSTISFKELGNATPRLIMAILLGLTISAPLETQIFSKEIEREWRLSMDQLAISKTYEIEQTEMSQNNAKLELVKKYEEMAKKQQIIVDELQKAYIEETTGLRGGRGNGPEAKAINTKLEEEKEKLTNIEIERDKLIAESKGNQEIIKAKQDSVKAVISSSTSGFLDQIMMLERLSANGKTVAKYDPATKAIIKGQEDEIYGSAFWPIWLVRLLFMIIEIAPVLLKLMLIKSPYDYMSENVSQILEAKQGISLKHMPDEYSQIHKLKENFNPQRIIAIVEHQNQKEEENAKEAITLFAEKEKQEIARDPEAFIKPDDSKDS
jgi:hypothetical protein